MYWEDFGFLLSKNRYSENSVIAEFYTENHGKMPGIIYGATSKKIKNYLEIGNKFQMIYTSKSENKIGYFKVEVDSVLTPLFFDNQKKLLCIISTINLIKILTVENQINKKVFLLIENFFKILNDNSWLNNFIFWELELFKVIGYDLSLKNIVNKEFVDNKLSYFVNSNNDKKIVPNFLVENNLSENNTNNLLAGLKLVNDYLDKSILKPNNIPYPKTRNEFISIIKK